MSESLPLPSSGSRSTLSKQNNVDSSAAVDVAGLGYVSVSGRSSNTESNAVDNTSEHQPPASRHSALYATVFASLRKTTAFLIKKKPNSVGFIFIFG